MVNTFLPYSDFHATAKCLDYRRLGKQRVEARQIIKTLEDPQAVGWKNHPAVKMWKGYIPALKLYFNTIVNEWIARGYRNNMDLYEIDDVVELPWWLGNKDFHGSHQASLVRKAKDHYEEIFTELDSEYLSKGYVWPKMEGTLCVIEFSPLK